MTDYINIKTNLFLWLLTGRSNDFMNGPLNTGITYSVSNTPEEVKVARDLLKLDLTTTDFYVLGALAAARISTSMLRAMPQEKDGVFVDGLLSLPKSGADVPMIPRDDSSSWPSIDGAAAGAGGWSKVTFTSEGSTTMITTNSGLSESTYHSLVSRGSAYRLSVPASDQYGVKADFVVGTWDEGDSLTVSVAPTRYPFKVMAESAKKKRQIVRLMSEEGTLQAFTATSDQSCRVGMVALAVIRRMIRHINDEQAGFAVTPYYAVESTEPLRKLYAIDPAFVSGGLIEPTIDETEPTGFDA